MNSFGTVTTTKTHIAVYIVMMLPWLPTCDMQCIILLLLDTVSLDTSETRSLIVHLSFEKNLPVFSHILSAISLAH